MCQKRTKRLNGEGTISFEKDRNKYRAFMVDYYGKRISKRFDTKEEASQWLAEIRTDIRRKEYVPDLNVQFGEWLISYLEIYKKPAIRETTYLNLIDLCKAFAPLSNYKLQDLNTRILQVFFNNLTVSSSTANILRSVLSGVFKKAIEMSIVRENPAQNVLLPKVQKHHIEVFTKEQVNLLLKTAYDDKYFKRYRLIFSTLFYTGARIGEVLALQIDDILDDCIHIQRTVLYRNSKYYINETKTVAGNRKVFVPKDLIEALRNSYKENELHLLFPCRNGNPTARSRVNEAYQKLLAKCDIPHKKIHAIRHTHITLLILEGVPITEIARRVGHSNVSVTMSTYAQWINGYDTTIADTVGNMFNYPQIIPTT